MDREIIMSIRCDDAARLVPAYLDGELSEAQAGPLRKHLLDCVGCRGAAQDLRGQKRWFQTPRVLEAARDDVPPGFAARVARRAFAGDTGAGVLVPERADPPARELLPFVRELTALAAAVLLMLVIGLGLDERPSGQALHADDVQPLSEVTERLESLNDAADRAPAPDREPALEREPTAEREAEEAPRGQRD